MKKTLLTASLLLSCMSLALAQGGPKKPAASPRQVVVQDFATSKITIDYSRPGVKGRTIFGDHEAYGKVWRTGANAVTTIDFGQDVQLEGHPVKAGKYALFTIPTASSWTIILNKDVQNWGTEYKKEDDVLRFEVPSYPMPFKVETLTINLDSLRDNSAILYIIWENTYVPIHLTTSGGTASQAPSAAPLSRERLWAARAVPPGDR